MYSNIIHRFIHVGCSKGQSFHVQAVEIELENIVETECNAPARAPI